MNLANAQIAVLAEHLYQELELWYPLLRLREEGANVVVISPRIDQPYASKLGYPVTGDLTPADVKPEQFDAVIIPGGFAPEGIRRDKGMVDLVKGVHDQGGLVAAICHAGWVLATAGIARGRTVTCVSLVKDDVINAGGNYVDQPVVRDGNIITSRLPSDLPVFAREIVKYLREEPSRRSSDEKLKPAQDRPFSSAAFDKPVHTAMGPRGKASANYITVVVQ